MKVPLFRPRIGERSRNYLETALETGAWASGPHVKVLEDELAQYTGYDTVIAVANGTMAARLIWLALAKEEFFVTGPTLTFASPYIEAMMLGRWIPGFRDIDSETWCLDTFGFEGSMFAKAAAVAVDYGGWPCPTPPTDGVLWIRDAAHRVARGMASEGAPIAFFVFHPTKPVGGLGGAAIALGGAWTHLEDDLRRLRDFGRVRAGPTYTIEHYGTNGYLPNASAAVALGAFEDLDQTTMDRYEIAIRYEQNLPRAFKRRRLNRKCAYHIFPALLPDPDPSSDLKKAEDRRAGFIEFMRLREIEIGIHYPLVDRMPFFKNVSPRILPVAQNVGLRVVSLPIWSGMTEEHVRFVCEAATAWLPAAGL